MNTSNPGGPPLGVIHFLDFMYDGQPEWSLFALRAPIDDVSQAFAEYRKARHQYINVPRQPAGAEGDELAHLVAVVQVKHNPWTIVFRSLLWVDSAHLKEVPQDARELSARLKTRAITFLGEDTSGAVAYEIFEQGKSLESAELMDGEFSGFKSTLRPKPDLEEVGDEFADAVFREQGIYLPSCYPRSENGKHWLAVEKVSAGTIERADLMEL